MDRHGTCTCTTGVCGGVPRIPGNNPAPSAGALLRWGSHAMRAGEEDLPAPLLPQALASVRTVVATSLYSLRSSGGIASARERTEPTRPAAEDLAFCTVSEAAALDATSLALDVASAAAALALASMLAAACCPSRARTGCSRDCADDFGRFWRLARAWRGRGRKERWQEKKEERRRWRQRKEEKGMKRETTQTLVGRAGDDARPFLEPPSTASGSRDLPRTGRDAPALVNINRGMLQRFPLLQNFAIPVCHTGGAHGDRGRAWGRLGDRRAGQAPRAQRRPACARALT